MSPARGGEGGGVAEDDAWLRRTLAHLVGGKSDDDLIRVGVLRRALELTNHRPDQSQPTPEALSGVEGRSAALGSADTNPGTEGRENGAEGAREAPDWVREASARMHAEHPRTCAIWATTGKCTCEETP